MTTLTIRFHPQVWINDYAHEVDPAGPTEWTVDLDLAATDGKLPKDDDYDSDEFRHAPNAPEWATNWDGPFYCEIVNRDELEGCSPMYLPPIS